MKSNPQIIRLDITNPRANVGQIVHIVGGDAGSRLVEAIIYDNGEARSDLKNVPAQLYIEPLSGKHPIFIDIVIVDGISTFTIPQSAGVTAGRMNAAVRIVSDDATEILSSMPFIIECSEPVYSESAVIGTDEADTLKAMVNDARESADTAASLAKTASDASSDAAKYAGECMNYARSAYESSVSAADSAESAAACIDAATQSAKTAAEQVLENKVDKSQVVSHLSANEQIPNGAAAVELCHDAIIQEGVSSAEPQGLTDEAKAIACKNIGATSAAALDELKDDLIDLKCKKENLSVDYAQGSISSNGSSTNISSWIRTSNFIDVNVSDNKKLDFIVVDGISKYRIAKYDSDGNFVEKYDYSQSVSFNLEDGYKYKVSITKNESDTMSASYLIGKFYIKCYKVRMKSDALDGKTVYGFGDSLIYGHYSKVGILDSLTENENMIYTKYAVNGAGVVNGSIKTQVENASIEIPDFIVFDGLLNDAYESTVVGELSSSFDTSELDASTFYGAFEMLISAIKNKYMESNIIYICPHKTPSRTFHSQEILQKAVRECCEKWSVSYVDIYRQGGINCYIDSMRNSYSYNNEGETSGGNGTHLTGAGYERWYTPMIKAKMLEVLES